MVASGMSAHRAGTVALHPISPGAPLAPSDCGQIPQAHKVGSINRHAADPKTYAFAPAGVGFLDNLQGPFFIFNQLSISELGPGMHDQVYIFAARRGLRLLIEPACSLIGANLPRLVAPEFIRNPFR